jgi:hypothetical protein
LLPSRSWSRPEGSVEPVSFVVGAVSDCVAVDIQRLRGCGVPEPQLDGFDALTTLK